MQQIDWNAIYEQQRAENKMRAHAMLVAFIARWSPESREDAARFNAELHQIVQQMQAEQYEMLRPVLENFLETHARPLILQHPPVDGGTGKEGR